MKKKLLALLLIFPFIGFGQAPGCTDSTAFNYNPNAITNDGSCCYTSWGSAWNQIGQDIDGEASGDQSGWSVSLSSDGNTIAIGAPYNNGNGTYSGHVRVYENINGTWTQIGQDIDGADPWSTSGASISINDDGTILAIGAPQHNGYTGYVGIYEWNTHWNLITQIYGDTGDDDFGFDLDLNSNGDILAVGSPRSNDAGQYSGKVSIYERQGNTNVWNQIGNDIDGQAANDNSGYSVSLSSDGNIVAIGAPGNTGSYYEEGYTRIYEYNGSNWNQLGQDLIGESIYDYSGYCVSLSSDGNRVSIGAPENNGGGINSGHVRVHEYNGSAWNQLGQDINGEATVDRSGESVSMSNDGNTVAIGAHGNDGNGLGWGSGHARIYNWDGSSWTQLGFDLDGDAYGDYFGASVSLSANGNTVAIGAPNPPNMPVTSGTGFVRVYNINIPCPSGCTDPFALNYDPVAVMDDGTCCYDCGKIEGFIYEDTDTSATFDSIVETPLGPQIIQLEKGSGELSYLTSQTDGYYSFIVDTGQQVITYSPPPFWESSNNNTQYAIDIQTDTTYSGLDFGIIPEFTKGDMTVDITTSNTVCNNTTTIWLTVRNEGTETITNVDLDLWVDPAYSVLNSGGGTQSGNHISWNFAGDFYPYVYTGEEQTFSVDVQIPSGPQGSSFVDSVRVTPVQFNLIEIDLDNNFGRADNQILCSYDPNDKQVLPKKCFYNELDTLDFTIRFQNTGNYPATTVTLVDSLDLEKLDIMSFHVLGASHDYEWSLKVPSVLEVVFDNIMLVDSSVSFNESQGFFKYRIVVRDSLADLQPSATPAFIYFDLNAPVVTNLPEINFVSNLSASMQSTNSSCNGSNDGTATLNIASITAPYTIAWNGGDTTSSLSNLAVGTYSVTLTDDKTCIYTDSVSINEPNAIASSNSPSICDGQSITVGSNTYNTSGTYTDVLSALNGCDSTVTTNLTVLANTSSNTTLNSCDPVSWNGQTYTSSGNYSFTTTNSNGCDSIANLDLTINSTTSSNSAETSCDNYSWNGNTYNSSGTYSWVGTNSNGCDSTATLNLTINSTTSSSSVETSCDSYTWNGNTYNSSGAYSWVGSNSNGCDSTATLNLTINSTYSSNNNLSICFGESVTVGSNTYNQTGTYTDTLTAVNGCDSTVTTNLTIYSDVVSIISQSGNDITVTTIGGTSPYSYEWNTNETTQTITPLANGDYWVIITDMNSCESDTAFFTVNWIATSINEINLNNLTIYPNPSKDIFNIVFKSYTKQDIDLRVHNVLGEVIFSESLKEFNGDYNRSVDLSQYPNAIYILQLNTKDGMINRKLVLEK